MVGDLLSRRLATLVFGSLLASLVAGGVLGNAWQASMLTQHGLLHATVIAGAASIVLSMAMIVTQTGDPGRSAVCIGPHSAS